MGEMNVATTRFPGMYLAEVIDTDDSLSGGRVKVRVFPMMVGVDVAVLPWATPAFGLFEGAAANQGAFTVPTAGSRVYVFFVEGDPCNPVYFANAPGATEVPTGGSRTRKVWETRSGHTIEIEDDSGSEFIRVTHKDGTLVKLDDTKVTLDPVVEVSTANTPLGNCITTVSLPNCFFSGALMPGCPNLKAGGTEYGGCV